MLFLTLRSNYDGANPPLPPLKQKQVLPTFAPSKYSRSRKWDGVDGRVSDGKWRAWDRTITMDKRIKMGVDSYTLPF